jgi:hypothetical protein
MTVVETKNERDRQWSNFRARLDASPKSPEKPNLILRILNSPFTIWLLSAIVITVGGSYITGYQKCEADAGRLITNYYKDQIELIRRFDYVRAKVSAAKSFEDINHAFETHPVVYDDLKNRTTRDLQFELLRTEQLIDFSHASRRAMSVGMGLITEADGRPFPFSPVDIHRYGALSVGEWPDSIDEADLDRAKHFVDVFSRMEVDRLWARNGLLLSPDCNFVNSLFGVLPRGPRKVVGVVGG